MKPMLASDAKLDKIKFPCLIQPKIDGVRGLHITGGLTGRSLKPHKNKYTTHFFNHEIFAGFDGEMIVGTDPKAPDLCRKSSSALGTIEGEPHITWYIFDYIHETTKNMPYKARLALAQDKVRLIRESFPALVDHIEVFSSCTVYDMQELLELEEKWLDAGYEGVIIRDPQGIYKSGRSTAKEGGLLRIKRFIDSEAVVIDIIEGEENLNEKQTNELGQSFRSSHQENKVGNGLVGSMICIATEDIYDASNNLLFQKDFEFTVSPGNMPHNERMYYYSHKEELLGKTIKWKFFAKGLKDKPRFPTYICIREKEDL